MGDKFTTQDLLILFIPWYGMNLRFVIYTGVVNSVSTVVHGMALIVPDISQTQPLPRKQNVAFKNFKIADT